jgi:hypothetical protein
MRMGQRMNARVRALSALDDRVQRGGRRARRLVKRLVLAGAPVITCDRCGRRLFSAYPVIANGRLSLYGAEDITVKLEWSSKRTLRFRHESLHLCRLGNEPLVSIADLGAPEPAAE